MSILFYRRSRTGDEAPAPPATTVRVWRPSVDGLPSRGSRRLDNLVWWAFSRLGVFSRPDFAEVTLWQGGRRVHRLVVTPRWYRFPFMDADDLQIGGLWTDPRSRREGLARAAIAEAHRLAAGHGGQLWYAVEASNGASIALAESCGYRLAGAGRRTRPFGIGLVGRFRFEARAT